ncbi:hypothetical protein QAD02_013767 [Eretmocerus hayati]|uniref:Uncharacterized protein n=1 Tax=Eretmocerus hayati TaxID=131215 RepID=A0ACC2P338_9HYME|nr:hypothetical protein QAD02_013767 [Eretmocerus hayati]
MACALQVWSCDRIYKCSVIVNENGTKIIDYIIELTNLELGINGHSLVLETSGTPIKHDAVLLLKKNEVIMLLQDDEEWSTNISILSFPLEQGPTEDCDLSSISTNEKENDSSILSRSDSSMSSVSSKASLPLSISNLDNIQRTPSENPSTSSNSIQKSGPESSTQAPPNIQKGQNNQLDFDLFQISWHEIATADEQALTNGSRDEIVHRSVAKVIISGVRVINPHIPVKTLRRLAFFLFSEDHGTEDHLNHHHTIHVII